MYVLHILSPLVHPCVPLNVSLRAHVKYESDRQKRKWQSPTVFNGRIKAVWHYKARLEDRVSQCCVVLESRVSQCCVALEGRVSQCCVALEGRDILHPHDVHCTG